MCFEQDEQHDNFDGQHATLHANYQFFLLDNPGRSSSRLYNVVCSPEVWRRLLWGIEEFSEAKVEDFYGLDHPQ